MGLQDEDFDVESPQHTAPEASSNSPGPLGWIVLGVMLIVAGIVLAPEPGMRDRGIVPELSQEPHLLWETSLQSGRASDGHVWIGRDHVVVATSTVVRSLELDTGEPVWEVRADRIRCARQDEDIACVDRQGTRSELIELTMADGEVGRTAQPGLIAVVPYEGGHLTLFTESDGLAVMRWGDAGQHEWTHRHPMDDISDLPALTMDVVSDLVLITPTSPDAELPGTLPVLDVSDGEARPDVEALGEHEGEWLIRHGEGHVLMSEAGQDWPGPPSEPRLAIDDVPGADVLLRATEDGAVVALSKAGGEQEWSFTTDDGVALPYARLDGTVVIWSPGSLHGLDADSGETRWGSSETPLPLLDYHGRWTCPCLGHGSTLAYVTGEEEVRLTALDVRTGESAWQVPLGQTWAFSHGTDGAHLAVFSVYGLSLWSLR